MKFAIVESGGKQYRAVEGGTIEVDRLPVETGTNVKLEQVLLLVDGETISVGTPLIKDTPVWTTVVEHFKGPKVNIFNYRPKKRIRVKIGHRQNYTRLFVEQIGGSKLVKKEPVMVEKAVEVKAEKAEKTTKNEAKVATKASSKEKKTDTKKASDKSGAKKPATKTPTKATATTASKVKKPAASSTKKTTPAKAEPKKKAPASSPKGKKPAAK